MADVSNWSFRGYALAQTGTRVYDLTGAFGLPPLRGEDFLPMGQTGRLFIPKVHDSRRISIAIEVLDITLNSAQAYLDALAKLFANRAQGALVYTDSASATRTAQAECVSWTPQDSQRAGRTWLGVADFQLADPWMYGTTVTGSCTPSAGLSFGTAIRSNISGPRTTYALPLSGVTSGQPILICHASPATGGTVTSIADTFAGHYTYIKVDGSNGGGTVGDAEIWIGTGGTGTSGTVTVTTPSSVVGGAAIPMVGASTGAGLAAIDVHGAAYYNNVGLPTTPTLSLTATAVAEGALFIGTASVPGGPSGDSLHFVLTYGGMNEAWVSEWLNPANGTPTVFSLTGTAGQWSVAGAVVKGSGAAPATMNITNTGTVRAEKITLDILGPATNPTVCNTTNGLSLTVNTAVAAGQHLIVDTGAYTALNNGVSVIGGVLHSGDRLFFALETGVNALTATASGATGATTLTVSFQPAWV